MSRQGFAHAIGRGTTSSWSPTCARLPQLVGGPMALAFIDLQQAYDRVSQAQLMTVLRWELELPEDLWGGLLEVLRVTQVQVCVGGE